LGADLVGDAARARRRAACTAPVDHEHPGVVGEARPGRSRGCLARRRQRSRRDVDERVDLALGRRPAWTGDATRADGAVDPRERPRATPADDAVPRRARGPPGTLVRRASARRAGEPAGARRWVEGAAASRQARVRRCGSRGMRFVVDCAVVLRLARDEIDVPSKHELLAPTLLRSQTLSALHGAVHRGELARDVAREQLRRIGAMPIRLLGDAVLRRRAWEIADQLGWAETYDAEYVALTQLQADASVTLDAKLARQVKGLVTTATFDALRKR